MRKSILFVFPVFPYPARLNGISVRYTPILVRLREEYDIHVAIVCSANQSSDDAETLRDLCDSVYVYKRKEKKTSLFVKITRRLATIFTAHRPHILEYHDAAAIENFFANEVSKSVTAFDAIVWVTAAHLNIGLRVFGGDKLIFDAIDSVYLNQSRLAARHPLKRVDLWRLSQWERDIVSRVHATIYISPIDAKASIAGQSKGKIEIIPNGVYTGDTSPNTETVILKEEITLGFIGHMGYPPNIIAAIRLAKIFDQLQQTDPRFRLLIIGRDPVEEISSLRSDKVTVTGTVDNIWEHMKKVDYFVFPMLSGAGQQNKVLEALYAKKVVFCNTTANGGIGAISGTHLQLCETDEEFVTAISALTKDPQRAEVLANAGYRFVLENYSWDAILPKYEEILKSALNKL